MEATTTRNMSFAIPVQDTRLAMGLARKMGWTILPQPRQPRKSSYERSREDIEAGRVYTYASLDDLIKEVEG